MNWKAIIIYGACLSVVQVGIGFAAGFLGNSSSFSPWDFASFVLCLALFAHLATHNRARPYAHACLALTFYGVVSLALAAMASGFRINVSPLLIGMEWLVLVLSMAVGVSIGSAIQLKRTNPREA